MTYATRQDMEERFGVDEIDCLEGAGEEVEEGVTPIDRIPVALADAAAEIHAVLAHTYLLPLPDGTWPALRTIQCSLARARLYDDATNEAPQRLRDQAMKLLREIVDGKSELVDADGIRARRAYRARQSADDRTMNDEDLARF